MIGSIDIWSVMLRWLTVKKITNSSIIREEST